MTNLPALEAAFNAAGRKKTHIARICEMSPETFRLYLRGLQQVPVNRRSRLDQALGVAVDWPAYDAQFAARKAEAPKPEAEKPEARPPEAPKPPRPAPAKAPTPAEAQKRPATAPRRLTASPPAERVAKAPARPAAPPSEGRKPISHLFGLIPIYADEA